MIFGSNSVTIEKPDWVSSTVEAYHIYIYLRVMVAPHLGQWLEVLWHILPGMIPVTDQQRHVDSSIKGRSSQCIVNDWPISLQRKKKLQVYSVFWVSIFFVNIFMGVHIPYHLKGFKKKTNLWDPITCVPILYVE